MQQRMKLMAIAFVAAVLIGAVGFTDELPLGGTAPMTDRPMTDVSGEAYALDDLAGENGLLVIFSCNTCPWVVAWEDRYPELAKQAKDLGIGMVLVNSNAAMREGEESLEAMRQRAKKYGYESPYVVDENSELALAFGATRTPHVFLFDGEMKLVYRGAIDDDAKNPEQVQRHYVAEAMSALVSGDEISPQETRSIGCGIKFP